MQFIFKTIRSAVLAGTVLVQSFALIACGSKTSNGGADSATLNVLFPKMYSGFDGVHPFKLPATVEGVTGIQWSASDLSLVDLAVDANGTDLMITMKNAGSLTITARAGNLTGSAPLTIEQFTPEQWEAGNSRYNDGVTFMMNGMPGLPNRDLACSNCHGVSDIQHTPTQTGGYTDADLIGIFSEGKKPDGVPQRIVPYPQWHELHQWTMTAAEKAGLVTYLRALAPMAQGTLDFGGRGPRGDGGMGRFDASSPAPDAGGGGAADAGS